jgi:hypothetical protein
MLGEVRDVAFFFIIPHVQTQSNSLQFSCDFVINASEGSHFVWIFSLLMNVSQSDKVIWNTSEIKPIKEFRLRPDLSLAASEEQTLKTLNDKMTKYHD